MQGQIKTLRFILGHSSVRTTELYVQNIDKDMKSVMNLPKLDVDFLNEKGYESKESEC